MTLKLKRERATQKKVVKLKKKFNRDQEAKNNSALKLSSVFITSEPCKAASSLHTYTHMHRHTPNLLFMFTRVPDVAGYRRF